MSLLKSEIRRLLRPLRQLITPAYREKAGQAVAEHFIQSSFFHDYQHFACYHALPEELNTEALIQALWQAGKACYLPVVSAGKDKTLQFALYEKDTPLDLNQYRVLEPRGAKQILSASEMEVVLLPLLAFDALGTRLGTGGGYYDRTFASKKRPHLIGLAYALQEVEKIPPEPFDVPMEAVVTEEGLKIFTGN